MNLENSKPKQIEQLKQIFIKHISPSNNNNNNNDNLIVKKTCSLEMCIH